MTDVLEVAEVVTFPGLVLIDHREKAPFAFTGFRADARQGSKALEVPTETAVLPTGDYSLQGFTGRVAVERKSLADLYHTLGQDRERFVEELKRLDRMERSAVVVEADWDAILNRPPANSRLPPKTVFRSILAWQGCFPRVHWWMLPSRRLAEVVTFRLLERFLRDQRVAR
jgi:ERCC4-type nuclease